MSEKIIENDLILQRKAKLAELRSEGNAYPNDFRRDSLSQDLHAKYGKFDNEAFEANPKNVILTSDCGVSILPKPHIGFTKFIDQVIKLGFSKKDIEYMIKINSKKLFSL